MDGIDVVVENEQVEEQDEAVDQSGEESRTEEQTTAEEENKAEEEFSVVIGDEPEEVPRGPAPAWVKEMRKQNRELKWQLRQLQQAGTPAGAPP